MILLNRLDSYAVGKYFNAKEFFSHSPDIGNDHVFDPILFDAANLIRGVLGVPVKINSSYRTLAHNTALMASPASQHLKGKAIDLSSSAIEVIKKDFDEKGAIFEGLRNLGINGFGIYDTFVHIDTRETGVHLDQYGKYSFWDLRKKKVL